MTPEQYVDDRAARSGSSFYYAFRFLPAPRRQAITAFYAFCREVDDVVDDTVDAGVARAKLDWWDGEIDALFRGAPTHPITLALQDHLARHGIAAQHLHAIVRGCRMDLEQARYPDFASLQQYCHLVAGVVGEVSAGIFGTRSEDTVRYAHTLGQAMQLTNIIRDVGEDARRGRVYLPLDELQRFGVTPNELLLRDPPHGYSDRFQALMHFQAARAHRMYDAALALLAPSERRPQRPGLMMAEIYRTLLTEIERTRFQVLHQRVALTPLRKAWIAMRTHWRLR